MTGRHSLQLRIKRLGVSQEEIALAAGYEPSRFSRILRGLRREPDEFRNRVLPLIEELERHESATRSTLSRTTLAS